MTQALYRFYGDAGRLLYVGITEDPDRRWKQHAKDKSWWREVRGITIDWYDTRAAVEAAERRAISVEQPAYNKALRRKLIAIRTPGDDDAEFLDQFERLWTSVWWDDPTAVDTSGSRYRHNGRIYAAQPVNWREWLLDLRRQGVTQQYIDWAVHHVQAATEVGPEDMWRVFWNNVATEALV